MEAAALCYKQTSNFQRNDCVKLLDKLAPEPGCRILDLGCGTGYLANLLAERVGPQGKVVAVDPDPARIKVAVETYGGKSNLEFVVANGANFPVDQYDIVTCSVVVHWIEDKEAVFKRVFESLKPGGRFAFTTGDNFTYPSILTDEILQRFDPQVYQATIGSTHWKPTAYYDELAKTTQFEVAFLEAETSCLSHPNIEHFIDFWYGVFYGKFDKSSPLLEVVRKKYKGQSMFQDIQWITAILTKPKC